MYNKRFAHAAGLLKAAIRHGQGQPWMLEALALAQQAAGERPEVVERTLLAAGEAITDSPDAQYRVARLLARYGRHAAAIRLMRQASEKAPLAYEPYAETLPLALQSDDITSLRWAATNLLSRAWPRIQDRLYKQARGCVAEMEARLRKQGRDEEAQALLAAVQQADRRDLIIEVSWQGTADVDLQVLEPLGSVCSLTNRLTPAGGVLVYDGYGQDPGRGHNRPELYVCARALPGDYEITLKTVWGQPMGGRVKVKVIQHQGTSQQKSRTFYVSVPSSRPLLVNLPQGRRKELLPIPQIVRQPQSRREANLPLQKLRQYVEQQVLEKYKGPNHLAQVRVGRGVVAYAPRIAYFPSGAGFTAQVVVSSDRRYVRIGIVPIFSRVRPGNQVFRVVGAAAGGGGFGFGF